MKSRWRGNYSPGGIGRGRCEAGSISMGGDTRHVCGGDGDYDGGSRGSVFRPNNHDDVRDREPNVAHKALVTLEQRGIVTGAA